MPGHVEDHYELTPPATIELVSAAGRRALTRVRWTGVGAQRASAAGTILRHATGEPAPRWLAAAFAGELLSFPAHPHRLAIAVEEVRAWRAEREPELAAAHTDAAPFSLPALLAQRDAELALGPRPGWLEVYRTIHGPPRLGDDPQPAGEPPADQ